MAEPSAQRKFASVRFAAVNIEDWITAIGYTNGRNEVG